MRSRGKPSAGKKSAPVLPAPSPHAGADILGAACLLFLGAALFLAPLTASRFEPVTTRSMQLLILVALGAYALRQRQAGRAAEVMTADWLLLAFLGWALLSIIPSVYKHATLAEFANLASYTAAFWLLTRLASRPAVFAGMAACLLAAGGTASMAGLREYGLSGDPTWRAFSTFFNPNLFAAFLITLLPFALACLLSARSPMAAFGSGLAAFLMGAALMATGSRAGVGFGLFGVTLAGLGALLRRPALPRSSWMRLLIVLALLCLISPRVARPFTERIASTTTTQAHSGSFRLLTWQATLDMVKSRPILGTGLGTYGSVFPQYARSGYTGMAHNSYLQYASETGLPGLLLFLAFLLALARHALLPLLRPTFSPRWPDIPEDASFACYDARLLGWGLAGGAFAAAGHNLIDYGWYLFGSAMSFWAVLGLLVSLTASPEPLSGVKRKVFTALAACFALTFALGTIPAWLTAMNASRAETALKSGNLLAAEEAYRAAVRLDPWDASYQRSLAQVLSARAAQTGSSADQEEALLRFRKAVAQ